MAELAQVENTCAIGGGKTLALLVETIMRVKTGSLSIVNSHHYPQVPNYYKASSNR